MENEKEIFIPQFNNETDEKTLNKLILLFVFDKMEVAVSENSLLDICCSANAWIPYMDCKPLISELLDSEFIYSIKRQHAHGPLFSITPNGRMCLAYFFAKIPSSLREDIAGFVKANRMKYRRKQEYDSDYYKNSDGTYTVALKILDLTKPVLEVKFSIPDRSTAKAVCKNWDEKAASFYEVLYDTLVD